MRVNEDRDTGTNGERVKSKDRKRRGEKDESLKGRHRIGQLLGPSLTLALTRRQLGQKGVREVGSAISCFVLITPADKPDELIGCFLLLIARKRETERDHAIAPCRYDGSPRGQARVDVISKGTNYWTDPVAPFANDTALCVWVDTQPLNTGAVISTLIPQPPDRC